MKFIRMMLLMLAVLPLGACALSGEAMQGRILEEGTNKPIPGAIVVVRWEGLTTSGSWFVEASTVCYRVETATTDEQGNYQTQAWRQPQHKDYTVKFDRIRVDAYKPGYGFPNKLSRVKGIEYLAPFEGSRGERLGYVKRLFGATACGAQNESEKNMLPLLKALYEEAKLLGGDKKPAPNEMSLLESLKYDMEIIELGFEAAEKRHLQRP